jgi:glycosyltransferase involved in cell wall biosynthesis
VEGHEVRYMNIVFYGNYAIKDVYPIYEASGWKCDEYEATGGKPIAKIREFLKIMSADIVYIVSGCDVQDTFAYRIAMTLGKKIVVHWIGTDVLHIRENYYKNPRKINANCENYAVSPWLVEELREIGILAKELPIVPSDIRCRCTELPMEHKVLTYLPSHRADFYNFELTKHLAEALPQVTFYVVGNDGSEDESRLPNIEYLGWLDRDQMRAAIDNSTILLRYPEHDGLPRMLIETLAAGREVVFKYKYPYVNTPRSDKFEDVLQSLKNIISKKPALNYEAEKYVEDNFSMAKMLERYKTYGLI